MEIAQLTKVSDSTIIDLTKYFTYKFPEKPLRRVVKPTSKAVFVQKSKPYVLPGTQVFEFMVEFADCNIAATWQSICNESDTETYIFDGWYGEQYRVDLEEIYIRPYKSWWRITGKFRILCVITDFDPCHQCQ